jgi:hypothetical protein
MMARSHSTLGCSQVVLKLLMNYLKRSDNDRTDPLGSPMSHVLADDERKIGR